MLIRIKLIAKQLKASNKMLVLYGARQISKTTMLKNLNFSLKALWINGDLKINQETVNHYIDLLEKGFVIKLLSGLSKNPRKEISKMAKFIS